MIVAESTSRDAFLANRRPGVPIRVVRMPTVQPTRRGASIAMVPAVELVYSFMNGDQQWMFREIRLGDERGRVDLGDTLWATLEKSEPTGYELVHRSGSF
jgi:hypothetical protein